MPGSGKDNIVEAKKLTVFFNSKSGMLHAAVNDLSFSLDAGRSLAVVGESGSGKTTLLRALLGLVALQSGSVSLFGAEIGSLAPRELGNIRRMCGYVPQDPYGAIPPGLSALNAVTEPALISRTALAKDEIRSRAVSLLAELGLEGERILNSRAVALSGGQRQRVEIARALMLQPKLLLCDEPTSMQDASTRGEIVQLLKRRVAAGMSMIFVTHDMTLAGRAAEFIIVMKDGKLCEEGITQKVIKNPSHPYTIALMDAVPKIRKSCKIEQTHSS
jgi:peptide/nickel transport system ATP-binding protein